MKQSIYIYMPKDPKDVSQAPVHALVPNAALSKPTQFCQVDVPHVPNSLFNMLHRERAEANI